MCSEKCNRIFYLRQINSRIHAWSEGTFVRNSEDRERVGIGYPAAQVVLTGDRNDRLRPCLTDDPPCQGTTGSDKEGDMIFIGDLDHVFDLASPALLAIVNIIRQPYIAFVHLKAMGEEKEYFLRLQPFLFHQFIVQVDDEFLIGLFALLRKSANCHEQWIEHFEGDPSHPFTAHQKTHLPPNVFLQGSPWRS
jgi:hypothetical protein